MAQEYTEKQLLQAGKDLVDVLLNVAKSNNNLTGFIKEYLNHLTSSNGIYQRQQEELMAFAASSDNVHRSIADNSRLSAEKLAEICNEFANMNAAIDRVHTGGKETTEEALRLAENITEIRKFIKDIQDISSRTNLLSFNASIEAARAGEAGKGFRIIANEVKSLSAKTQEVSKHIDDTILEMHSNLEKFVEKNTEHSRILGELHTMADDSKGKLGKLTDETNRNAENANDILNSMNKSIITIQEATRVAEENNLEQVEHLAQKAMAHTIHVDDELSFLFELQALFDYLEKGPSTQAPAASDE
jgi:methyl-accepting chemotaxis protein